MVGALYTFAMTAHFLRKRARDVPRGDAERGVSENAVILLRRGVGLGRPRTSYASAALARV